MYYFYYFPFPSICVFFRLDEWANLHVPLCRGGRDEPHPLWAGVHRGYQPAHADPWDPHGGPGEADWGSATSAIPAHSHNYDAGAREDCRRRWGQQRHTKLPASNTNRHWFVCPALFTSSTGDDGDPLFSRPRDLDLIQSVPSVDLLNMKAPPRILTLTEQPLDSLETDQAASPQSNPSQAVRVRAMRPYGALFHFP